MTSPSQPAGVFETPAAFLGRVFDSLQPMIDALSESAAATDGHAFRVSDLRWLEATPDGSSMQHCRLMWRETVLLEMQMSADQMLAHLLPSWPSRPH